MKKHYAPTRAEREIANGLSEKEVAAMTATLRRHLRDASLPSVAERSGVTTQTLYNIINRNVTYPHVRTLIGVGRALGLKLTYVLSKGLPNRK